MTRSWTDPRTGRRWKIQAIVSSAREPGRGSDEDPPTLVFRSEGESLVVSTPEAIGMERLSGDRLVALLDEAERERRGPDPDLPDAQGRNGDTGTREPGPGSPNASGRESQPHMDLAKGSDS